MNSPITLSLTGLSVLLGFSISWTGQDIAERAGKPSASLPPAIEVNEITLRDDGSVVYDAIIKSAPVWQAWSGVILLENEDIVHCKGGDLANYPNSFRYDDWNTDYMVGDECVEGLRAGMRFVFTWTPVGPDYAPVRYPATGYGMVKPAE